MRSRIEERDDLLTGLGLLIDPIRRLVFADGDPNPHIPYVRSQFYQDLAPFREDVTRFCRPDKFRFETELDVILRETNHFVEIMGSIKHPEHVEHSRRQFPLQIKKVRDAIRAVPCDDPGIILPTESPYTTYLHLAAICRAATGRLQLFDPYLEAVTFHRYLPTIPDNVQVVIVTNSDVMDLPATESPTSHKTVRRDRIVSVSELLASQFRDRYQFRVSSEQHDRHIRVDETILHLGGSAKDAGRSDYFTISKLDPIQSTQATLDGIIARATEWFGPSVRLHRRA